MDIFPEIKMQRYSGNEDDVTGQDITEKFAGVYKELFNRSSDDEKIEQLRLDISKRISQDDFREINHMKSSTIREALKKIKSNKSDPLYDFSSCYIGTFDSNPSSYSQTCALQ